MYRYIEITLLTKSLNKKKQKIMGTLLTFTLVALLVTLFATNLGWNNLSNNDRNSLIFETRNKEYGAYDLRKNYGKNLAFALLLTIFLATTAFVSPLLFASQHNQEENLFVVENTEMLLPPPVENPEEVLPPPPPPPPAPVKSSVQFTTIDVTEEEVLNPPPADTQLDRKNIDTETVEGEDDLVKPTEIVYTPVDTKPQNTQIFNFASEQPTYPGGESEMYKEIQSYIVYPEFEKQNGIEGTVYVNFVVEVDGSLSSVQITRGVDEGPNFSKTAQKAVSNLKLKFAPAKMNGNPVRLRMTIPIKFTLR
jgi:protein TonB